MHNTATGPTVIDEANPTPIPRRKISIALTNIQTVLECKVMNLIWNIKESGHINSPFVV
jgi:hypothetical protein